MSVVRRLPPLPSTRDIMRIYGIRAKRKLSQNFLLDPKMLDHFARSVGALEGKIAVEVGPGPGGVTRALIANGAREVHVIEKDSRFLPSLQLLQEASGDVLHINLGNVLHYNMSKLFPDDLRKDWNDVSPDICLVGNLPFNVSTVLMIKYLRSMQQKDNIFSYGRVPLLLTFQHEVAYRLIAPPNDLERSRISVMCQNYADVKYKYTISGGSFQPRPQVDAGVVKLLPLRKPYIDLPFAFVERVTTALFRGKQKYIRNSAKFLFPNDILQNKRTLELLDMASVDKQRLPYTLNMDEIEALCFAYKDMCDRDPIVRNYVNAECAKLSLAYQESHGLFLDMDKNDDHQNLALEEDKSFEFP